jgi:hypothetical protein
MTTRATLEALLARVLKGTGPDRELDLDIDDFMLKHGPESDQSRNPRYVLPYTASLDAALTLVPEGKAWTVGQNVHHWYWSASVNALDEDGAPKSIGWGGPSNSPALALCAAALQARMEALGE